MITFNNYYPYTVKPFSTRCFRGCESQRVFRCTWLAKLHAFGVTSVDLPNGLCPLRSFFLSPISLKHWSIILLTVVGPTSDTVNRPPNPWNTAHKTLSLEWTNEHRANIASFVNERLIPHLIDQQEQKDNRTSTLLYSLKKVGYVNRPY